MKKLFGDLLAGTRDPEYQVKTHVELSKAMNEQPQQGNQHHLMLEVITFDSIEKIIIAVRSNVLVGKGRMTPDEHLAEDLYAYFRHIDAKVNLTYERIDQAIKFVKGNDVMGAGKWSKEMHLTEYLFALYQLSKRPGVGTDTASAEATEAVNQAKSTVAKKAA